jgi:hypothetical protein
VCRKCVEQGLNRSYEEIYAKLKKGAQNYPVDPNSSPLLPKGNLGDLVGHGETPEWMYPNPNPITDPEEEDFVKTGSVEVTYLGDDRNKEYYNFGEEDMKGWHIGRVGTVDMLIVQYTTCRILIPIEGVKKVVVSYNRPR